MPNFSQKSLDQLSTCHLDLQVLFQEVVKTIDCTILEGHRGEKDQNEAYDKGNSKLRYPYGKHNAMPSMAVDCLPYPIDWKNLNRLYWFSGFVLGIANQLFLQGKMSHKIRWGGDFNGNYDVTDDKGLVDLPHYELLL